jgi:hypothetical protein
MIMNFDLSLAGSLKSNFIAPLFGRDPYNPDSSDLHSEMDGIDLL